jgi:hypothetical protein
MCAWVKRLGAQKPRWCRCTKRMGPYQAPPGYVAQFTFQGAIEQSKNLVRRDSLLLAAESGLSPRATMRWLTGGAFGGRRGAYGTTDKILTEVALRLGIERRGAALGERREDDTEAQHVGHE